MTQATKPKVELISRGWDVVEIETIEAAADPLGDDVPAPPLPSDSIEISADDITVVARPDESATESAPDPSAATAGAGAQPATAADSDRWSHLRPQGQLPPLLHPARTAARVAQMATLLMALAALAGAILHFFLNLRLEGYADQEVGAAEVADAATVADISLLALSGAAAIAIGTLVWWLVKSRKEPAFRLGIVGIAALTSIVAGGGAVAGLAFADAGTVGQAIALNSLMILALGLIMIGCLAMVRTIVRADRGEPQ
jgi:hypothetical protein